MSGKQQEKVLGMPVSFDAIFLDFPSPSPSLP